MNSTETILEDIFISSTFESKNRQWQKLHFGSFICLRSDSASNVSTQRIVDLGACLTTTLALDLSVLNRPIIALPKVHVKFKDIEGIETLLGEKGMRVLKNVISFVENMVAEENWPLTHIEAKTVRDIDVKNWEYVLLNLGFETDFETADDYLQSFYKKLDEFLGHLPEDDEVITRRMFFFDVAAAV